MNFLRGKVFDIRELKHPEETRTPYGYIPHFGINVTFLVSYGILGITSTICVILCLSTKHRRWLLRSVLVTTAVFIELAGFVERVRGAGNPRNYNDFLVQLTLLNSAPAFIIAAISTSMYQLVISIARHRRCKINPRYCLAFGLLDLAAAAFVIFGSLAAFQYGSQEKTPADPSLPSKDPDVQTRESTRTFLKLIMAAMAVQIFSMSVFLGLLIAESWRRTPVSITMPRDFVSCMVGAGILVIMRAVAKIAEGGTAPNEWLFLGLDSILMVVAIVAMVVGHPILSWAEPRVARDDESLAAVEVDEEQADGNRSRRHVDDVIRLEIVTPAGKHRAVEDNGNRNDAS